MKKHYATEILTFIDDWCDDEGVWHSDVVPAKCLCGVTTGKFTLEKNEISCKECLRLFLIKEKAYNAYRKEFTAGFRQFLKERNG